MRLLGMILNLSSRAAFGFWATYVTLDLLFDEEAPSARSAGWLLLFWIVNWLTEPIQERRKP